MIIIRGIITHGARRGRLLGYPTANIELKDAVLSGVYAGRAVLRSKGYGAAVFADPSRGILEAHLLDFEGDIYGEELTVEVGEHIRCAEHFDDEEELKAQIRADIERVRALSVGDE